jgi:hypothetical protein
MRPTPLLAGTWYQAWWLTYFKRENLKDAAVLNAAGYLYSPLLDKYTMAEQSVDLFI